MCSLVFSLISANVHMDKRSVPPNLVTKRARTTEAVTLAPSRCSTAEVTEGNDVKHSPNVTVTNDI